MDTTSSGPQDPGSPGGPQSVDAEARFLESLLTVFKDNRDVLHRLPDMIEQHLKKEPLNPDLAESGPKEENRYTYLKIVIHFRGTCKITESILTRGNRMFCKDRHFQCSL